MEELLRPLRASADPNRLRILRILAAGPFNVAELTEILDVGQSTVSRHLKILADAGLVQARRSGTWAWYSLHPAAEGFAGRLLALLAEDTGADGDRAAIREVVDRRRRATSAFFRRTASVWDALRESTLGPSTHLGQLVGAVRPGGTVVDLGTGTGVLLEKLAPRSQRLIGVDASPEMLDVARRHVEAAKLSHVELRLGALEHLPLSDGEADTMVANMVLHHVANPPEVLREIRRGLKPQGRLVVADLEEHAAESFWQTLGAQWPGFRHEDVARWLDAAGFVDVRFGASAPSAAPMADAEPPAFPHTKAVARPDVFLLEATRA
ncbi:MAG: metalloregulator ArsR/SmtB family transcription factor [bacterium]